MENQSDHRMGLSDILIVLQITIKQIVNVPLIDSKDDTEWSCYYEIVSPLYLKLSSDNLSWSFKHLLLLLLISNRTHYSGYQ